MSKINLADQSANPSPPAAGQKTLYVKSDGLYVENSAGTVTGPLGTGGGGEVNTGANVGGGAGVFRDKTSTTLNFRSLVANSAAMVVTQLTNTVSIAFGHLLTAALNAANNRIYGTRIVTHNGIVVPTGTSVKTVNWTLGAKQAVTLTENVSLVFTDPAGPVSGLRLLVTQDATGGRSMSQPSPNRVKAQNGSITQPSQAANAQTLYVYDWDGTSYIVSAITNLSFV